MDSMVTAYKEMWSRWSDFSGRSSVGKYWWAWLLNLLIVLGIAILGGIFGAISDTLYTLVLVVLVVYYIALIIPGLALSIRRLHDTDRSGWWILIGLIPLVGPIVMLVFLASAGTPAANQYGPPEMSGAINP